MALMRSKKLFRQVFEFKETRCTIISDSENAIEAAISSIKSNRKQLEQYIRSHPKFLYSLEPVHVAKGPRVAKLMAEAAEKADVGPMAAVAGVLADLAVEKMVSKGAEVAVLENGGEAYAVSNTVIDIALSAGDAPLSRQMGFRLEEFPIGIATSSGVFSHALSFGDAEAVTIFAENAGLADAAATAVGNLVRGDDRREAIESGICKALSIKGVSGVLILYKEMVGKAGRLPRIIKVNAVDEMSKS